jgi:CBS domain-containing protein
MGHQLITSTKNEDQKKAFTQSLLNDIHAFEQMLNSNLFENDCIRIGAEQELVIVGKDWMPFAGYQYLLNEAKDPDFTTELGRFNLEINLPPFQFEKSALREMENLLALKLKKLRSIAQKNDSDILLTGILPTIHWDHLKFDWMTPNPRYEELNNLMKSKRASNFEIDIRGLDELKAAHPNILFEACNTSFQVHLQIPQDKFAERYNWAQLIAGPVLAASCNSPLLMSKRLWSETRIALFQQSIDTRNSNYLKREIEPRVSFGRKWIKESVLELYQENVAHYNLLIAPKKKENSVTTLENGGIPKLPALCIHNGTVYSWNRACYGISDNGKPHLRIENRYLPAGPTIIDEMANAAFWLGLMMGMPNKYKRLFEKGDFDSTRQNFYRAAQFGIDATMKWFNKTIPVQKLILDQLLPMAKEGLDQMNIDIEDSERYLKVIEERVKTKQTGSKWTQKNFTLLLEKSTKFEATTSITRALTKKCWSDEPVHTWEKLEVDLGDDHKHFYTVRHLMKTDIVTLQEDDILDLAINLMVWKNIRYVMVENNRHQLVGLVSSRKLIRSLKEGWNKNLFVKDIMEKEIITVLPSLNTDEAVALMVKHNVGCLPVVAQGRLLGLVTERDLIKMAHVTQKFKA